ncbi:MAG: hypothetical protein ABIA93_04150 [Candidatus Woesearchaeota archaeon]
MKGSERNGFIVMTVAILVVAALAAGIASADPLSPQTLTESPGQTRDTNLPSQSLNAQAGNVTAVNIHGLSVTDVWQGYFGNITGTITLDDASNNTFYNWSTASPTGEIFASRAASPTWATVECANVTHVTAEEAALTIGDLKSDGINETFTKTTHDAFSIGETDFIADDCSYTTNAYGSSGSQDAVWDEVLLYDTTSATTVFATIIGQDSTAFNGGTSDFEMLIPTDTTLTTTQYYFFVQLS